MWQALCITDAFRVQKLMGKAKAKQLVVSPLWAGESHLANKRLFCCGKSILGVLR
ncbi:hypothetical protein ACVII0_006546 [Sinorhizobium meliloti]